MIGMGAKSITIVRVVTADFFFDCRAAEIPSDEWIRDVPWGVHNHAQDLRLDQEHKYEQNLSFAFISNSGRMPKTVYFCIHLYDMKVNMFLCIIKLYAMNMYVGVYV
jgi:hypothetical protein